MGVATVRTALQAYIAGGSIPGLHKVFRAPPRWVDGQAWQLNSALGSGAVAALHMAEDTESRITVPAPNVLLPGLSPVGQKIVSYKVGLMIFYQFLTPSGTLTAIDEDAWAAPLDVIIDGVKDLLRADPNAGNPAVIWQCAQGPNGIRVQRDIPTQDEGKVLAWNVVEFDVDEVISD